MNFRCKIEINELNIPDSVEKNILIFFNISKMLRTFARQFEKSQARYLQTTFEPAKRLSIDYLPGESVWTFVNGDRVKYDCINHGQGFPNWQTEPFIKNAVQNAISEDYNQVRFEKNDSCRPFLFFYKISVFS